MCDVCNVLHAAYVCNVACCLFQVIDRCENACRMLVDVRMHVACCLFRVFQIDVRKKRPQNEDVNVM